MLAATREFTQTLCQRFGNDLDCHLNELLELKVPCLATLVLVAALAKNFMLWLNVSAFDLLVAFFHYEEPVCLHLPLLFLIPTHVD